jgi:hypothetical protein
VAIELKLVAIELKNLARSGVNAAPIIGGPESQDRKPGTNFKAVRAPM